ncbi:MULTISPECIES: metal-dependent transcriptional regulator [unclassified Cryobacterium]|uniref:metal-dependent transcriptional regulator n=1 Tax=unclassified Cryobacterium TaxID=2649013 RepID=UPI002AB41D4A|nr:MULTISPECIES: metal-dependent transcriptional regulator [unclassified Cryobacterium]MDY7529818.1 metal-dependent transcriptional regulator [Cryobacterium sp. 10C2]MDY7558050.1 metal-dependent transcriptional regulator [Cryobacterium sp. 10C3]MEB0203361.1 metal-dependent transcriptional regulator [Cryobacterium sp. 5I3]MEB0291192.1 metal-dependent transcriptional regulator [Cryobacterium sp. 10C2]
MKHNGTSTPASEDYLKTIYAHTEWQPEPITPSALAARLGIAPSSVTEMVKKLAAAGLITHVPYGPLSLTPVGLLRASAVVRRHRLIETWLVREMGYDWDEVHDEAEILEHSLSDRLLDAIDERLGRPAVDPHGDAIPAADGSVTARAGLVAAAAGPGLVGVVLRISDRDPVVLRGLARDGIGPGTVLALLGPGVVRLLNGSIRHLTDAEAASIWLDAEPTDEPRAESKR